MLETTKNYGLLKPTSDEFYDVGIQNGNMDQVDQVLTELENSKAKQTDVDASIEGLNQKMIEKADRENPVFTGKVTVPELSADPSDNEAATVKFVRENGGGAAAGVSITAKTQETTGAGEPNVESALGSVGTRLGSLETAVPSPTESGTILYSTGKGVRRNIPFLIGEPKPISNFKVERFSTLGSLNVGDKVKFGNYNGVPIVWRIADKNHEGYPAGSVTLITDKIISLKCFDAIEPNNPNSDRKNYGNNRHSQSNIDRWLNSSAGAGAWWAATHSYDAAPTNANVWSNYNEYDKQAGFLYTFSANMRNALLSTSIVVAKNTVTDGGGSETISRKVFLASTTEVGLDNGNGIAEGNKLAIFSDNASRQAYPTAEAVANSEYTDSSLSASQFWYWWLRTPYASSARHARDVYSDGTLNNDHACNGYRGVRPLCNVSEEMGVKMDSDGTYTIIESDGGLNLTWTNPTDLLIPQTVHIRRSTEAYPTTLEDGVEVYSGSDESYLDETADLSTDQYYTAWVDNSMVAKTDESMKVKYEAEKGYLMLYDHGDECVDVTGGWDTFIAVAGKSVHTKNADNLEISISSGGNGCYVTHQKLKQFAMLEMVYSKTASDSTYLAVRAVNDYSQEVYDTTGPLTEITTQKMALLDIKDVIQGYHIFFTGAASGGKYGIHKMHCCFGLYEDDYTPWLRAGNLNPSNYPTLASLLADETAMGVLMNSSVAVDRMIRYTGTVMAGVINSETAMTALGLSPYVTRVMQNPDWAKFLGMSPHLGIWKDQANTKKVPVMTSDTTPEGVVSADSVLAVENAAWKAFDSVETNLSEWATALTQLPHWIQYKFPESIELFCIDIVPYYNQSASFVKDFEVFVGDDESSFVSLGTYQHANTTTKESYPVVSARTAKIVRLKFMSSWYNRGDTQVNEIQFYGK